MDKTHKISNDTARARCTVVDNCAARCLKIFKKISHFCEGIFVLLLLRKGVRSKKRTFVFPNEAFLGFFKHCKSCIFCHFFMVCTKLFYPCLGWKKANFFSSRYLIRVEGKSKTPNWDDWLRVEMIGNYLHWRLLFFLPKKLGHRKLEQFITRFFFSF